MTAWSNTYGMFYGSAAGRMHGLKGGSYRFWQRTDLPPGSNMLRAEIQRALRRAPRQLRRFARLANSPWMSHGNVARYEHRRGHGNEQKLLRRESEGRQCATMSLGACSSAPRWYSQWTESPLHSGLVGRPPATLKKRIPINLLAQQASTICMLEITHSFCAIFMQRIL